jgi:Protein of unknown function (DUF3592).
MFGAILLILFGFAGLGYGFVLHRSRNLVLSWPQVPGKIFHREVVRTKRHKGRWHYAARLKYAYLAGGAEHVGARIYRMGEGSSTSENGQRKFLEGIPEDVMVRVDPYHPEEACLFPETWTLIALAYGLSLVFLGIGVGIIVKKYI